MIYRVNKILSTIPTHKTVMQKYKKPVNNLTTIRKKHQNLPHLPIFHNYIFLFFEFLTQKDGTIADAIPTLPPPPLP
jgi:hypothetical protein